MVSKKDSMEPEKRKRLIAARFARRFEHFGFKKTSVDDVAKELAISKKTIYQFFSTKEEIFYHVVRGVADRYARRMEAALPAGSAGERISALVRMIFTETRKWLKTNDAFEFRYKYEIAGIAFQDAYSALFLMIVTEGIARKELAEGDPATTVSFMKGVIAEGIRMLHEDPSKKAEEDTIKSLLKLTA
jgi:AcrR family transcriptional regulator